MGLASYGFRMDFALSSSAVLGAAVLLWLLWVAPYTLRRLRPAADSGVLLDEADGGAEPPLVAAPSRLARSSDAVPQPFRPVAPPPASESPEEGKHVTDRNEAPAAFRIRWGRCALAGLGLGGLLLAAVSGVLAVLGIVVAWLPLAAAAVTVSSVVVLRRLAVRDRRRRMSAALRAAASAARATRAAGPEPVRHTATEVFDHQPEPEPAPAPLSREALRAAALEVARAAQEAAALEASRSGADQGEEWEPVDLPKPAYVDAAKVERDVPEPLETPAQPKPTSKVTLKPKPDASPAPGMPAVPAARPAARGALGNLDAVLQRRRA